MADVSVRLFFKRTRQHLVTARWRFFFWLFLESRERRVKGKGGTDGSDELEIHFFATDLYIDFRHSIANQLSACPLVYNNLEKNNLLFFII